MDGFAVVENRLYVLASAILDYHRANVRGTELTASQINMALVGFTVGKADKVFELPGHPGERLWHEINLGELLRAARRDGWKSTVLEDMINKSKISVDTK